jgi:DNA modification methylase
MKKYELEANNCYIDVYHDDCLERLKKFKSNFFHSCVIDPPYLIKFMNQKWDGKDSVAHTVELWREVLRVLRPGGYCIAFASTRTYHILATVMQKAGFVPKNMGIWCTGQGMSKGLNISKGIDNHFKAKRKVVGYRKGQGNNYNKNTGKWGFKVNEKVPIELSATKKAKLYEGFKVNEKVPIELSATKKAKLYEGFNTQLKPAIEPFTIFQKPISEKNIVLNILRWNTGAFNIDACRIKSSVTDQANMAKVVGFNKSYSHGESSLSLTGGKNGSLHRRDRSKFDSTKGRWPANLILDDSKQVRELFPHTKSGAVKTTMKRKSPNKVYGGGLSKIGDPITLQDKEANEGSAARFFYVCKANKRDRNGSKHNTIKPIKLMRYLVRLITPPDGITLDCFAGTGTTGFAASLEGFDCVLIEKEKEYILDILKRFD